MNTFKSDYQRGYDDGLRVGQAMGSGTCELEPLSALDVMLNMLDNIKWGACSECGFAVPMDAKFCNECGKAVSA